MPLTPGTRLGPYEVTAQIGVGGMGEVYQATDTNLKRAVAIKVLPASLAGDVERLARFQREAEVLASLNHPNIAAIYGLEKADGTTALVMELVEGPTLADRIAQGAIPVDEALPIAKQIAEALEAAHEQGIIHRDLKPANVKVRPDGAVKVLDFGLAKALEPAGAMSPGVSQAPTITTPAMTQAGMILGTAAYMSPEQAKGRTVDKRSDVWAFGAVLYEMLAGRRAFDADDVSETLAAVLMKEPDWAALPPTAPPAVTTVLQRCLHKNPKQRIRDIGDVSLALEGAFDTGVSQAAASVAVPQAVAWRRAMPWITGAIAGGLVIGLAVWVLMRPAPQPVERFVVTTPGTDPFAASATGRQDLAISPDGTRIVYRASADGTNHLFVRPVGQLEGYRLFSNVAPVSTPAISPDGAWVVFRTAADQTWKKVSILGGPPLTLFPVASPRGASWGPDDTIIFAHVGAGLFRGPAAGGDPETLTTLDAERGETGHAWPEVLPGGTAVLFTIDHGGAGIEGMELAVLDLGTMEQKVLLSGGSHARYAATGHLVYGANGTLRAVPFDLARLAVTGDPVPLLEGVMTAPNGAVQFSLSADGSLVYVAGDAGSQSPPRTLVWVDRQGREEPLPAPPRTYRYPRLSPDGTKVALDIQDQENDIWVWDVPRVTLTRLTFDPGLDRTPVWTPDGQRIAFSSQQDGPPNLFWQAADGTGSVERLLESTNSQFPTSFSPDGARLVFGDTPNDIAVLALEDERQMTSLVQTTFSERSGEISPDGRWLAYESNESGQREIYVRPFPDIDTGRWQVSTGGGNHPVWARSGEELFYLAPDVAVMRVAVEGAATFRAGTPTRLFQGPYLGPGAGRGFRTYDVSPDGQRFLMIKEGTPEESGAPPSLILVQNWTEELKRLVPAN